MPTDPSSMNAYKDKSDGEDPPPGLELLYSLTESLEDIIKMLFNRKRGPYLLDLIGEFFDWEKLKKRSMTVYN